MFGFIINFLFQYFGIIWCVFLFCQLESFCFGKNVFLNVLCFFIVVEIVLSIVFLSLSLVIISDWFWDDNIVSSELILLFEIIIVFFFFIISSWNWDWDWEQEIFSIIILLYLLFSIILVKEDWYLILIFIVSEVIFFVFFIEMLFVYMYEVLEYDYFGMK